MDSSLLLRKVKPQMNTDEHRSKRASIVFIRVHLCSSVVSSRSSWLISFVHRALIDRQIEFRAINDLAVLNHYVNLFRVVDVYCRIGLEQDEVGELSGFNRAQFFELAEKAR